MCLVFAMPQSSTVLSQFPLNWRKSGKIASATDSSSQTFKRTNLGWCVEAVPGSLCRSLNVLTVLLSCSWASCSSLQVLLSSRLAEHDWGFIEIPRVISGGEDLVRGFQEIVLWKQMGSSHWSSVRLWTAHRSERELFQDLRIFDMQSHHVPQKNMNF